MRKLQTSTPAATILIRLIVGLVFTTEGLQKFLYPDMLGVGRFIKLGIPAPGFMAAFVGVVEIVFGALIVIGLMTRRATIPLAVDMIVAIITTKMPIFVSKGFWIAIYASQLDFVMLLGLIFLFIEGPGSCSIEEERGEFKEVYKLMRPWHNAESFTSLE